MIRVFPPYLMGLLRALPPQGTPASHDETACFPGSGPEAADDTIPCGIADSLHGSPQWAKRGSVQRAAVPCLSCCEIPVQEEGGVPQNLIGPVNRAGKE